MDFKKIEEWINISWNQRKPVQDWIIQTKDFLNNLAQGDDQTLEKYSKHLCGIMFFFLFSFFKL